MPYLAGNKITMQTDTGGGNPDKANNKNVQYTSPYKTTSTVKTTTPVASTAKSTSTGAKTATTSTAATNTAQAKKKYYTYNKSGYSGGYSGGGYSSGSSAQQTDEAAKKANANYNAVLQLLNQTANKETTALTNNANNYTTAANQNLAAAEQQYNAAYNRNIAALDALAAQNSQREQATMDAITNAYNAIIGNADDYYSNLIDTYNRSMGWVDQGFNEGNEATARARDEAIQLAAQLYEMGEATQNRETERALQGQYTSYMKGMRNLNQRLAALGYNGGATETSMLNALNGYESNRTDLNEAKLAALGALRQQQMQSDSEAQQSYLNKLADLITNRTNQYLGVENNRSQGEYNYANMKNSAESDRGNQTVAAQNNFQNWAADLTGQRTSNNNSYASNMGNLANSKNDVAYNTAGLSNAAAQAAGNIYTNQTYADMVAALSQNGAKAKVEKTDKQKEKDKKAKEKEKKKNTSSAKGGVLNTLSSSSNNAATKASTSKTSTTKKKTTTKKSTK